MRNRRLVQLAATVVRRWHSDRGARLINDVGVSAFLGDDAGRVRTVELADGQHLHADPVVVGVGVRPATGWLQDTPVHLARGAIGVDTEGRTNLPRVYAAGDVTATWDDELGQHVRHEHRASAIDQGQRVANAITGTPQPAPAYASFWSDQYDRNLQYVGSHDANCDIVVRGDFSQTDAPALAFFLRAGRLAAVLSVNNGKDLRRAQRLTGSGVDPIALADADVDLRQLAPLAAAAR